MSSLPSHGKKKVFIIVLSALVALVIFFACEKDEGIISQSGPCDLTNVSYKTDIQPILSTSCVGSCHNASTAKGGTILEDYTHVKAAADNNNNLANSIKPGGNMRGYLPSGDTCSPNKITVWVSKGAPNN